MSKEFKGFTYYGGKKRMADWIILQLPDNYEKMHYAEIFFGGGAVFFKKKQSILESINDLDESVYNLYKQLKDNPEEMKRRMDLTLYHETELKNSVKAVKNPEGVSPIDLAVHRFNILYLGFSSSFSFGFASSAEIKNPNISNRKNAISKIPEITKRLKDVQIFSRDAKKMIKNIDSKETIFYLDPPYPEARQDGYLKKFSNEEFIELLEILKNIKGKFILSFYMRDWMEEHLQKNWIIKTREIRLLSTNERLVGQQIREETIARNYECEFDSQLNLL